MVFDIQIQNKLEKGHSSSGEVVFCGGEHWFRTGETLRATSTVQLAASAMLTRLHTTQLASGLSGQTDSIFSMNN